jgi:two-component system, NarL family, sensor histidine kinase BarA
VVEGIPLSQKSLLLFTITMTLVATTLVATPWLGQWPVVDAAAFETLEKMALAGAAPADAETLEAPPTYGPAGEVREGASAALVSMRDFPKLVAAGGFPAAALAALRENPDEQVRREALSAGSGRVYRVALAQRDAYGNLIAMTLAETVATRPQGRLLVLRVFTIAAAFLAAGVAALAFYFITSRLVLSPVRELSSTAARVSAGDLSARTRIESGDEFEVFAGVFNDMLATLERQQEQLRGVKESLDLEVAKLSEANVALHETAKLKGDFLATVSHELRTPLNSIIGFADLLLTIAQKEKPGDDGMVRTDPDRFAKRTRYLENILTAGRSLLEMINDLLEMARIEAGKVDLDVGTMNVGSACEGLLAMIRPQAQRKNLDLVFTPDPGDESGPQVVTDPRKFQQIIFNFLSNAVKFTPEQGRVELRVERLTVSGEPQVRVSVIDTGPGIPQESQSSIFEKFTQLDAGHERQQQGAGLGLAICKELGNLIQGEIHLDSAAGRGSMFSLIVPERMDPQATADAAIHRAGAGAPGGPASPGDRARAQANAAAPTRSGETSAPEPPDGRMNEWE